MMGNKYIFESVFDPDWKYDPSRDAPSVGAGALENAEVVRIKESREYRDLEQNWHAAIRLLYRKDQALRRAQEQVEFSA